MSIGFLAVPIPQAQAIEQIELSEVTYTWETDYGTPLAMGDDYYRAFDLPFSFEFYGKTYTRIYVSSNGYAGFEPDNRGWYQYREYWWWYTPPYPYCGAPFQETVWGVGRNIIMAYWADLNPRAGGQFYANIQPNKAIFTWENIPRYYNAGSNTFQLVLTPPSTFQVNLNDIDDSRIMENMGVNYGDGVYGTNWYYYSWYCRNDPNGVPHDQMSWANAPPFLTTLDITEMTVGVDGIMPGGGTIVWVTAENVGSEPGVVDVASLSFSEASWTTQALDFYFDDADGDGYLDVGGSVTWVYALVAEAGTPEGPVDITASIKYNSESGLPEEDVFTLNIDWFMTGNRLSTYRHSQAAQRHIRAADFALDAGMVEDPDGDYQAALAAFKTATDQGYKEAHSTVSHLAQPSLGYWGLAPGQEEGNEGNGQGGLTGK